MDDRSLVAVFCLVDTMHPYKRFLKLQRLHSDGPGADQLEKGVLFLGGFSVQMLSLFPKSKWQLNDSHTNVKIKIIPPEVKHLFTFSHET
jgi:hypothetical protein